MDCKKSSRAGVKIGKLFGSAGWQDFSDNHVPKPHNRVVDAGTINSFDYQSGRPSSLCWPLHKIHERETSGEIFFLIFFTRNTKYPGPLRNLGILGNKGSDTKSNYRTHAHQHNPRFVYFLPTFWSPKNVFSRSFFLKILALCMVSI